MADCSTGGIPARLDTQPKSCVVKRTRGSQRASSAHQKRERRVPTLCLQPKSREGHGSPKLRVRSEQAQRDAVAGLQPVGSRRQAEKKTSWKGSAHIWKSVPESSNSLLHTVHRAARGNCQTTHSRRRQGDPGGLSPRAKALTLHPETESGVHDQTPHWDILQEARPLHYMQVRAL